MDLEKCKMMLNDLTKVALTQAEMEKSWSVLKYTCEQITSVIDDIVLDRTPERKRINNAKLNNLQMVKMEGYSRYWLHLDIRNEISRLIKLHEELHNDSKTI